MAPEAPADLALVDVGRSIYEARRVAGLSQRGLAERCGIDQGSISRLERGLLPGIKIRRLCRLIAVLGRVDIVWTGGRAEPRW
jgi:transcriptional regulator with XRE-family HTH domain